MSFKRKPITVKDGIPVFSESDAYVANYDDISNDHIAAITRGSENPNIPNELWEEMEASTIRHVLGFLTAKGDNNVVRILDVGVGLGRLLNYIHTEAQPNPKIGKLDLHGMDISLPYLKIAY